MSQGAAINFTKGCTQAPTRYWGFTWGWCSRWKAAGRYIRTAVSVATQVNLYIIWRLLFNSILLATLISTCKKHLCFPNIFLLEYFMVWPSSSIEAETVNAQTDVSVSVILDTCESLAGFKKRNICPTQRVMAWVIDPRLVAIFKRLQDYLGVPLPHF